MNQFLTKIVRRTPVVGKLLKKNEVLAIQLEHLKAEINAKEDMYRRQLRLKGLPHKLYPSYAAALADCQTLNAYENEELVKTVIYKQNYFNQHFGQQLPADVPETLWAPLFAINYACLHLKKNKINIIDFGGSGGGHYFLARNFLSKDIELNWCVVETEKMVAAAESLKSGELSFASSLEVALKKLGHVDLFYTSGTIQYLPDPYKILNEIVSNRWPLLLFNRTAFTKGDYDVISIQKSRISDNGPSVPLPEGMGDKEIQYPFTYVRFSEFEKILKNSYLSKWVFNVTAGYHMVNEEPIFGNALIYELKNGQKA